jgi:hypothetical protein
MKRAQHLGAIRAEACVSYVCNAHLQDEGLTIIQKLIKAIWGPYEASSDVFSMVATRAQGEYGRWIETEWRQHFDPLPVPAELSAAAKQVHALKALDAHVKDAKTWDRSFVPMSAADILGRGRFVVDSKGDRDFATNVLGMIAAQPCFAQTAWRSFTVSLEVRYEEMHLTRSRQSCILQA